MPFWIALLISLAFSIAGQLLAPKTDGPKPEDKPQLPDIDETRPIPVLWGEWLINNPQLFWWGDYTVVPIKKKIFTGIWFKKITTGFKYSLGMALGLCDAGSPNNPLVNSRGIEGITEIQINEKVLWTGSAGQGGIVTIDVPGFFGGNGTGGNGGVKAQIEVHTGDYTPSLFQTVSTYLSGKLTRTPTWKGLAYLVWRGPSVGYGYYGNSASIEPLAVRAHRRPNVALLPIIGGGTETYAYLPWTNDANPVHCLLELFLNEDWGMGDITLDDVDEVSWRAAAQTCYNEGNGFSYYWDRQSSCEDMAGIILKQIDGVVYTDFATGLLTLKLARNDYNVIDLPVYDNDNFVEISNLTRGSWDDTINEVRVNYTDHLKNFKSVSVFDQDLANFVIQDSQGISASINYPGVSNEALARQLARRDLQVLTQPLLRFNGTIDRTAHDLNPGDPFVFSWPEQNINSVVMRVTTVRLGTLQQGLIELECVEDKFATATAIFTETSTGWTAPVGSPAAVVHGELIECPYYISQDDEARALGLADRPDGSQTSYQLSLEGIIEEPDADFTPSGVLHSSLPAYFGGVTAGPTTVDSLTDIAAIAAASGMAGTLIKIDDEYLAYDSINTSNGQITNLYRGLLDTVPQDHSAGARVWWVGVAVGQTETSYPDGTVVNGEFLTQTANGVLDSATAPDYTLTVGQRSLKPYRPTALVIQASMVGTTITNTGDVTLGWSNRNRLTESTPLSQLAASEDKEFGTQIILKIYGNANVLLRTETLDGDVVAFNYTNALEFADAGALQGVLTFQLYCLRDGLYSHQVYARRVTRTGGVLPGSFPAYTPPNSYVPPPTGNTINGDPISSTPPTNGQVLAWNNTTHRWEPITPSVGTVLTVEEVDGAPSVVNVNKIKFKQPNLTVTDEGSGVARIEAVQDNSNFDFIITHDSEVCVDEVTGEVVYYF
jgi:hypothetical protein